MQTDNNQVVDELLGLTEKATTSARRFKELDETILNFKDSEEKWSILECIEHLNRYGDYYLPEIRQALLSAGKWKGGAFRSGFIGNYFANLMRIRNGKIVKMKTPADKNPAGSKLTPLTIDRFLKQQEVLRSLLLDARHADLMGTKVPISIARFVRLQLGDTLRFFVYHIDRHMIQAEKMASIQNSTFKT
jgi:hypothetical protein